MQAQSPKYGNEWIDYTKTYFKFKVAKNGVHRIYYTALSAAGIPGTVSGSNFQLFRDGKEVPIYVSAQNMGASDYIEFYGRKADGSLDKELYPSPVNLSDDRISLFTDTASYFLCYDAANNHSRYTLYPNVIPGGSLSPEPYLLNTVGFYPKIAWVAGESLSSDQELTSSLFESGEGFIDNFQDISNPIAATLTTPNLVSGVAGSLHASIITRSYFNNHRVRALVNNFQLADSSFGICEAKHYDLPVPAAQLNNTNDIRFIAIPQNTNSPYDGYGISFAELEYPRNYDLNGIDQLSFRLPATGASQYLEFTNLGPARLYDIGQGKYYEGNTVVAGKTRFYLDPATVSRDFVIVSNTASSVAALTPVKKFNFTNYSNSSSQGDFVIISHAQYMPATGTNYVNDYRSYRSSTTGGGHKVALADVTELYDQFAYGYDIHPLSIKHFLQFAYDTWTTKPGDVLLLGRGLQYDAYQKYQASVGNGLYPYPIVPTYGNPGSDVDFVMFGDQTPRMRIGRVPAWTAAEVGVYLDKLKAYEAALLFPASPTTATELWKKRAMHVVGASDANLQPGLQAKMDEGAAIIRDTLTGMNVFNIAKVLNVPIQPAIGPLIDSLLRNGTNLISFYGHGSTNALDYNLPDPNTYTNVPHYPFFTALGCDVSQMFTLSSQKYLAERYLLTPNSGSIGFLASDNVSYTIFDDSYLISLYNSIAHTNYGSAVGNHYNFAHNSFNINSSLAPNFNSTQLESMILGGDPSLILPSAPKPDYAVSPDGIVTIPGNVSTTLDTFQLKVQSFNLGKAIKDTVLVKVEHINPKSVTTTVATYTIYNLHNSDTTIIKVPIDKVNDIGLNKLRVTIDAANRYDEVSELNNVASIDLFIFSDVLVPIYPKEFAIVNNNALILKASTLNPFRPMGKYRIQLDTTELFNSSNFLQTSITSPGGVIKWTPGITLKDSMVYYWRAAFDSVINGDYLWTNSSFIYLQKGTPGWNQSHYFQFEKDNSASMVLNGDRRFRFNQIDHQLQIDNTILGGSGNYNADGVYVRTYYDNIRIEQSSYNGVYHALFVTVIDSASGRIWINSGNTPGAPPPGSTRNGLYSRMFDMDYLSGRNYAAHFIDSIPDGNYILIRNVIWDSSAQLSIPGPKYVNVWKSDSVSVGSLSKTLYGVLKNNGFGVIDSFYRERVFIMMRRKNDPGYPIYQSITDSLSDHIGFVWTIKGRDIAGSWNSTVIGPAKDWQSLKWKTSPYDTIPRNDTTSLSVIGINASGLETIIYPKVIGDTSLTGISATQYPKIRLVWNSKDSVNTTSTQLNFWRVLYTPLPEAALNPAAYFVFTDSVSQGQQQNFAVAIENLTEYPMDSMLVRYKVIGSDGVSHQLNDTRYRKLPGLDTLHATLSFNPNPYPGKNLLFIEANPANDQPEEYHPNNLGYLPFTVSVDTYNPLLDVTFDGTHILNGDIVSAKPFIKIRLKDENQFLKLDDTGLMKVSLRYPGQINPVSIPFDGNICRFIPAVSGGKANEASVEFRPILSQDGIYQLSVSGADKSGNGAGASNGSGDKSTYFIEFEVDNTPAITHVLNYPNPFSTATAFVFTLTGSQIPSQLKIQVLTVTGKVVREITRDELGPLRIGRNVTQYQWDGRDQFGQLLGNGVYLYRVVTSLNGTDLELRGDSETSTNNGFGIDKYFKNNYGKMYIMR